MDRESIDVEAIRTVLRRFQDGYVKRDISAVESFMELFARDAELEVIGTGACQPGEGEWCLGPAMVRELVESDWRTWGDLRLDVDNARIHCLGEVGWLATAGTVSQHVNADQAYRDFLDHAAELTPADHPPEERLLRLVLGGASTLYELRRGEEFTWPLRFTAVLTRDAGDWKFVQMTFAFPTIRWPQERVFHS